MTPPLQRQAQPSMVVLDEEGEEVGVASLALCDKAAPVRIMLYDVMIMSL